MLVLSLIHIYNVKAADYSLTNIFADDNLGVLLYNGVCNKDAPSECQQHWPEYGEDIYSNTLFNRL